jgi:prolyl oligopeptidase
MNQRPDYPATRRTGATEQCAGVTFADPYRWLEEESGEVQRWQAAQAALATHHVRDWPHFERLKQYVSRLYTPRFAPPPREAAGLWFRIDASPGAAHTRVIVAESRTAEGRVLYDPAAHVPATSPFLSWIAPSPDGRTLALGICTDASENNRMRLIDVVTGAHLEAPSQLLMDNWLGGVQWLPDSSGFFYTALVGTMHEFRQAAYFHRLGEQPPSEPLTLPIPKESRDYRGVVVSRCGRWAVALHRIASPVPVALRDLSDPVGKWRPFITEIEGSVGGYVLGDKYVAVTDVGAPRGRVVAISLDGTNPNDPATWTELVPESCAVIRSITPVDGNLYVHELVDTYARVRWHGLEGSLLGEVPLPGKGAVAELGFPMLHLFARSSDDGFVFGFSTLTQSVGLYRHRPGQDHLETVAAPRVCLAGAIVRDHWATSADGTQVPYHTVRLASITTTASARATAADTSEPQPALLCAYGAAGVPFLPQFPGAIAAFVAAGGVLVHAHLRGGGELGRDWWRAGTLQNR